jgi:signal transduction histidine kinase
MLLALALALLVAQSIGAILLYRAEAQRRESAVLSSAVFRLVRGPRALPASAEGAPSSSERMGVQVSPHSPVRPGERRDSRAEKTLAEVLAAEGMPFTAVTVVERAIARDPLARHWLEHRGRAFAHGGPRPRRIVIAAIRRPDGQWLHARVPVPGGQREILFTLIAQTLFIYLVLVGAAWLLLRRITRPLAELTRRLEGFATKRDPGGPLVPTGPEDLRRLIAAHNGMEARIAALLDEKDVMLGAIGHDLKTPLAALRVRIEAVEDEGERARLAAGIDDINRSLDDILSLARVGRPSDPLEPTELSALVASVVEEYEDMSEPVEIAGGTRIVLPLRGTWLRRALRNLIDNALRYGQRARVSLAREDGFAVVRVDDDGPGIADSQIARMLEPFTRLDASRSSTTGGAGLGLTLARAIAEQHGGSLRLDNRWRDGRIVGLAASLRLPLHG